MLPRRRDCAKSVIDSNNDLNKVKSWAFALWSVAGLEMPLMARELSTNGRTAETALGWSCGEVVQGPS